MDIPIIPALWGRWERGPAREFQALSHLPPPLTAYNCLTINAFRCFISVPLQMKRSAGLGSAVPIVPAVWLELGSEKRLGSAAHEYGE